MSEIERQIEHQVNATGKLIKSLAEGSGPMWYEESTGQINEPLLVAYLIDKHGLTRNGNRIEGRSGQIVTPDAIKRFIAEEIGPFIPTGTARRIAPIYRLLQVAMPEKQAALKLNTFSAADLAGAQIPPTPFVVNQLLPCGLTILAAPPKTGKSWLCLALADAVATGATFWGYNVTAGDVLYLALEDNKSRLQSRLRAIGSRMPANLHMVCRNTMCLDNGLIDQLEDWIKDHPATRLIILDTLQRVKGAAEYGMDAYAADYKRIGPLQELATEKNVAILAIHHLKKQGNFAADDVFERISGSTALFGASDACWVISGKRGQEEMDFHLTGRDVFGDEFKIQFDKETSRWRMLGNSEQLEEQRRKDQYNSSPLVTTIRELVQESGGRWIGSTEALKAETMKRTQTVPAGTGKALHNMLYDMQELLLTNDGIVFSQGTGGRAGRDYTFEKTKQTSI